MANIEPDASHTPDVLMLQGVYLESNGKQGEPGWTENALPTRLQREPR